MPRSEEDEKLKHDLKKQLNDLEHEWNSYKQFMPRHRRSRSTTDLTASASPEFLHLIHNSPKRLLLSIQQHSGPPPSLSSGLRTAEEIAIKRRAAVRAGRVQGRRLFEDPEYVNNKEEEEVCSISSLAMIKGSNRVSSCSCCSSVIERGGSNGKCLSSSSSSCGMEVVGRIRVSGRKSEDGCGGVWKVGMPWMGLFLLVLLVALVAIKEYDMNDYEYLKPT